MATKNIDDLDPRMREEAKAFMEVLAGTPYLFKITQVLRSTKEQEALYAQGRQDLATVNDLRREAGLLPITPAENENIITKALHSRHMPNKDGFSEAFDIMAFSKATGRPIKDDEGEIKPYYLAYVLSIPFTTLQSGYALWGMENSWDKGHYQMRSTNGKH